MKKMKIRTDLAVEAANTGDGKLPNGVFVEETEIGNVKKTVVEIKTEEASKRLGRPKGRYITLEGDFLLKKEMQGELETELKEFLPQGDVLVAGFGNTGITPDSIGPLTAERIMATSHLSEEFKETFGLGDLRKVSVVFPGATGQTGIETTEFIKALVDKYHFSCVVTVDALASLSSKRLGNTLQIANSGISPGSGVGNRRMECSHSTIGVPVISIGVPTVTDAFTLVSDYSKGRWENEERENMLLTPKDIDQIVKKSVEVLSMGINFALQGKISHDDLEALL